MRNVYAAARELQRFCLSQGWSFCFIGGVAYQRWGDPRVTLDADATLLTGFGDEERFVDAVLQRFQARIANARAFGLKNRVLLIQSTTGTPIDVALGALPFEQNCIRRASPWEASGDEPLITCSAEDLIVHKAVADRLQDWADIERIIMRQGRKLNVEQIWTELRPLVELKEEPEILAKLQRMFDKHLD